jgi:hypothetical protein
MGLITKTRNRIIQRFSPASLGPALWFEAAQSGALFSSNAGTGGVVDGGVVGYVRDLSVNGFDLTSYADDTTRPTWNSGGGVPYLNFDGSNDVVRRAAALGMYAAGACSVFVAVRANPAANTFFVGDHDTGGNNSRYAPMIGDVTTSTTASGFIRNTIATTILAGDTDIQTLAWNNADRVYGVVDNGLTFTPYLNGVAGSAVSYTRSGSFTLDIFGVGALARTTASAWFAARVYAVVIVKRTLSWSEISNLNRYLARRAGMAL